MLKTIALFLAISLILSIAACGGGATPSGGGAVATTQAAAVATTAAATAAATTTTLAPAPAKDPVRLSAVLTGYGRYKDAFDAFVEKFIAMELEMNDVVVTINMEFPQEKTVLQSRMASNETPDIFNMHVAIDAPLFDKGGLLPNLNNEEFVGKLYDGVRDMVTLGGKVVAVPMESFVWSCLYNKTHFEEQELEFPKTLSELRHAIDVFQNAEILPFMSPFNDASFCSWASQIPMCAMAAQLEPDFYDKMNEGVGSFQTLVDRGWLDIVDLVFDNVAERALDITREDGLARFANGDGAMLITGPWYSSSILDVNPDFNLGLGALPIDEDPSNAVVMLAISNVITCSPDSSNFDIAKDFINYLLNDDVTDDLYSSCLFNQVAVNQNIEAFPWTLDGLKCVEEGRVYGEYSMPSVVFTALNQGAQMYFDKQVDRAGFVKMMDEAYASGVEALS